MAKGKTASVHTAQKIENLEGEMSELKGMIKQLLQQSQGQAPQNSRPQGFTGPRPDFIEIDPNEQNFSLTRPSQSYVQRRPAIIKSGGGGPMREPMKKVEAFETEADNFNRPVASVNQEPPAQEPVQLPESPMVTSPSQGWAAPRTYEKINKPKPDKKILK